MNDGLPCTCCETITNDFVTDLKNLSLASTEDEYNDTVERLHFVLKHVTPKGNLDNLPFALAFIDNFHRAVPIFDKKLSNNNSRNAVQTHLFLQTLASTYNDICLFDLFLAIKETQHLELIFDRYFPLLKENYFTDDCTYDHLINCLLPIIAYSSTMILLNEENVSGNLFSRLSEFVKKYGQSEERKDIIHNILVLMKVMCKAPRLLPIIVRSGWPELCLQWLTTPGPRKSYGYDLYICIVMQKMAREPMGVEALKKLNFVNLVSTYIDQIKKDYTEEEYNTIHFGLSMTYALLVEADEIKQNSILADKLMCYVLQQLISFMYEASKNPPYIYKGFSLTEMLCVLGKLFVNDDILIRCLKENSGFFDYICQLLLRFASINTNTTRIQKMCTDEALLKLTNILWSISFHPSYHENFKSNIPLMQTLSNIATSSSLYVNNHLTSIPTDIGSLRKAAESILWNLNCAHLTLSKEKLAKEKAHVMISYSHSDSKFCHELVEHLSNHIPVWVDYKQGHNSYHSDDLWEEIAAAMETATVIVLIISKEYYDSKSCRQELSYACDTLKKRIVPIYAPNLEFKANGWLGIRIAGQKYVHFGRKSFTDALSELLSLISVDKKSLVVEKPSEKKQSVESTKEQYPLHDWTAKDIRKWFEDNHIHNDLITLLADQFHTGTALIVYAYHLKQFYRNEYIHIFSNYRQRFDGKKLQTIDFVTFVDALWRLRQEYDPQSKLEDTLERTGGRQLCSAMKLLGEGTTWL